MSGGRLPDLVSGEKSFPLGATVTVTVDRPLGSLHPDVPSLRYPVNYGFIAGIMAPDGEEQDAYILGVSTPCRTFTGKVIAIVRRRDDVEDKWVVAPPHLSLSREEIWRQIAFQERWFDAELLLE